MRDMLPMNLQLFAEPAGGAGGEGVGGAQTQQQGAQASQQAASPIIDYAKIQQMLEGTLAAKEDTALKAYFKQQGLSQEEVEQAIAAFKQQKAACGCVTAAGHPSPGPRPTGTDAGRGNHGRSIPGN